LQVFPDFFRVPDFSGFRFFSGFFRIIMNLGFFKQKRHQIHKLKENNKIVMMIQKKKVM
jgi:hypothetical protein